MNMDCFRHKITASWFDRSGINSAASAGVIGFVDKPNRKAVVDAWENDIASSTASKQTAGAPLIPVESIVGRAVPMADAFPAALLFRHWSNVSTGFPFATANVAALNQMSGDNCPGVHTGLPLAKIRRRWRMEGMRVSLGRLRG